LVVYAIAERVVIFVDESLLPVAKLREHRRPRMPAFRKPAVFAEERASGEHFGPFLPTLTSHESHLFLRVAAEAGILVEPFRYIGGQFFDACDLPVRLGEIIDERRIEHVPFAGVFDFRNAMPRRAPAAPFEANRASERAHVRGRTAAERMAVHIESLDGIVHTA